MAHTYQAPLEDLNFILQKICNLNSLNKLPDFEDATPDLVEAVLAEANKFASGVLAPLNEIGDTQGSKLVDGKVVLAEGFKEAYQQFVENCWGSLDGNPEFGGQGMPKAVGTAVNELWQSANMAFALGPMLTYGATDAVEQHASEIIQSLYLEKLISGEWSGTMNLTEPQAGSDLSAIRSKAIPEDNHYRISGQKIFISWGDHEAAENIIHLVLARLPDAPKGVRGISLFLVPKLLLNEDGSLGNHNDVHTVSLEHKLGIHGSPTCSMSFGDNVGAIGYLIGEENKGLACMFTMMNAARLAVGLQGVAIGERAYQASVTYATERVQGGAIGHEGNVAIIEHPDVRRMLLMMRALTEAGRALSLYTVSESDRAHKAKNETEQKKFQDRVDLLTPIVKGWATENGQEVTSTAVQIFGGMGYVEETGVAQYFRDARITTIYEGTTGIQALDLVGRKTLRDQGDACRLLIADMIDTGQELQNSELRDWAERYHLVIEQADAALQWLLDQGDQAQFESSAIAVPYMMLMGTAAGAWMMVKSALACNREIAAGNSMPFHHTKIVTAQFYLDHIAPRASSLLLTVKAGSRGIMQLDTSDFGR